MSSKISAFSPLLKLKADQEFVWGKEQQLALDGIKNYLVNPLVLIPPQQGKPFRLYLSTVDAKLICKHKGLIPDSNVKACQPI